MCRRAWHTSADRALREASQHACGDPGLLAGILAIQGMNQADRGRHTEAAQLLTGSSGHGPRGRACPPGSVVAGGAGPVAVARRAGAVGPGGRRAEHGSGAQRAVECVPALASGAACPVPGRGLPLGRGQRGRRTCVRAGLRAGRSLLGGDGRPGAGAPGTARRRPGYRAGLARRCPAPLRSGARPVRVGLRLHRPGPAGNGRPRGHRPGSHLLRPASTSTRCSATCRSSWPGRWCTKPSLATMPKSRWRAARLLASPTPFCRPGSGPCRPVSSTGKAGRKEARRRLRDAAPPARQLRYRRRRRALARRLVRSAIIWHVRKSRVRTLAC